MQQDLHKDEYINPALQYIFPSLELQIFKESCVRKRQ